MASHYKQWIRPCFHIRCRDQLVDAEGLVKLKEIFNIYVFGVLGLASSEKTKATDNITDDLMRTILNLRTEAKNNKDYSMADKIRDELNKLGITIKDGKDGVDWEF